MSIYSTEYVSRDEAVRMILKKIGIAESDEELGNILDRLYSEETLYNYIVTEDGRNPGWSDSW